MIESLAKFIDWSALQIGYAILPQSLWRSAANARDLELEQAIQFLNGPDFIPAESQPAQLDFGPGADGRFRFATPRPCEFPENNVVHGRLYRCAEAWQERPVVILLHGGGDIPGHRFALNFFARRCSRAGLNAATLELPYHFQRRPPRYGSLSVLCQYTPLISEGYLQMARTYAQAIAEVRSLIGRLLAEGCPAVALAGASLGAYLAGLTARHDARLASIVLALSTARPGRLLSQIRVRRAPEMIQRRMAACEELDKTPLNLTLSRPAIARENVLLIEAIHDLLVLGATNELWQSWGQPEIWRLPQGHVSTVLMPGLTGRIVSWLATCMSRTGVTPVSV